MRKLEDNAMKLEQLCPYVQLAKHSRIAPPWDMRERVIFDYELLYVESGQACITVEGQGRFVCTAGDIVLFKPNERHSLSVGGSEAFYQPHVHFDLIYTERSSQFYVTYKTREELSEAEQRLMGADLLPQLHICLPNLIRLPDPEPFRKALYELIDLFLEYRPYRHMLLSAKMLELLYWVIRAYNRPKNLSKNDLSSPKNHEFQSIRQYIEQNYDQSLSLEHLSSLFSVSKYHLIHRFRELYDCSPIAYANLIRVEKAKQFLNDPALSVTQISELLGFSSIYAFSRFLKMQTGLSPTEIKRGYDISTGPPKMDIDETESLKTSRGSTDSSPSCASPTADRPKEKWNGRSNL